MKKINLKFISTFFLTTILLINLLISTISNYSTKSFILKIISTFALLLIILIDSKINNFEWNNFKKKLNLNYIILVIIYLLLLPLISLFYSHNISFGIQKILSIIFSTLPAIFSIIYLIITFDENKFNHLTNTIILLTLSISIYIIIFVPFNYSEPFNFSFSKWSPVIIGRLQGIAFIVSFYFFLNEKNLKKIIIFSFILILLIYSSYLTGLRSNLIMLAILTLFILIFSFFSQKIRKINLAFLFIIMIFSSVLIYNFPIKDKILLIKYKSLDYFNEEQFANEGSIIARKTFIVTSMNMIKEKPIFGWGFGGFRIPYSNTFQLYAKYPHNIFLESWIEMGILSLILLIFLLTKTFMLLRKNLLIISLFIYFLGLSMIAKDIATNTFLWCFFAFLIYNSNIIFNPDLNKET